MFASNALVYQSDQKKKKNRRGQDKISHLIYNSVLGTIFGFKYLCSNTDFQLVQCIITSKQTVLSISTLHIHTDITYNCTYLLLRSQAVYRPPWHLVYPNSHHRQSPTVCYSRLPLYPHTGFFLQQDEGHHW